MTFTPKETALIWALLEHYRVSIEAGLKRPDLTDAGRKQYQLDKLTAELAQMKLEEVSRAA